MRKGGGAEDAPKLEDDDVLAWNFYWQNARPFVRDFGLMDSRLDDLGIEGVAKDIFIQKLSIIHETVMEKAMDKSQSGQGEPASIMYGTDND